MKVANIYRKDRIEKGSERFDTLFENGTVSIEKIQSNQLNGGKWYDQQQDEWVVLLEGRAELEFVDKTVSLQKGDSLLIPRHTRHKVAKTTEDALWLAVHAGSK